MLPIAFFLICYTIYGAVDATDLARQRKMLQRTWNRDEDQTEHFQQGRLSDTMRPKAP